MNDVQLGDLVEYYDNSEFLGETKGFGYVTEIGENNYHDPFLRVKWVFTSGYPESIYDWRDTWYEKDFILAGFSGKLLLLKKI